jgi:hypothetical protein
LSRTGRNVREGGNPAADQFFVLLTQKAKTSFHPYAVWVPMHLEMNHSFLLFAMRVIEVMFFTGLVGCATVIVVSWISIFGDGFSDPRNNETDSP